MKNTHYEAPLYANKNVSDPTCTEFSHIQCLEPLFHVGHTVLHLSNTDMFFKKRKAKKCCNQFSNWKI